MIGSKHKANPSMLRIWIKRNKCWSCKHRFTQPVVLPVKKPEHGKLQPNINAEVLLHQYKTHGIPPEVIPSWIIGSIYGLGLNEFGMELMK